MGGELDARSRLAMFWMILCGESWARSDVGRHGPRERRQLPGARHGRARRLFRRACAAVPRGAGPSAHAGPWSSSVPVLLLAGAADPQDPPANLRGWRATSPTAA